MNCLSSFAVKKKGETCNATLSEVITSNLFKEITLSAVNICKWMGSREDRASTACHDPKIYGPKRHSVFSYLSNSAGEVELSLTFYMFHRTTPASR